MRVLHVIPSLAIEDGGPPRAMAALTKSLDRPNVSLTVLTTGSQGAAAGHTVRLTDKVIVVTLERNFQAYKVAVTAIAWLSQNVRSFDLVHVHAVFSFLSAAAALIAHRKNIPYIVRPLGVLNRWGMLKRRPLAKRISYSLVESRILRRADLVHFTSKREAEETYEGDPQLERVPSTILPIPVEVPQFQEAAGAFQNKCPELEPRMKIVFMSRFAPQKGLELLLPAFAKIKNQFPEWTLVLAGSGDPQYVQKLHDLARELAIDKSVTWAGYLSGAEKWSMLSTATIFVLPSYSESF